MLNSTVKGTVAFLLFVAMTDRRMNHCFVYLISFEKVFEVKMLEEGRTLIEKEC